MYSVIKWIANSYLKIFHRFKIIGLENVPEGKAVLCANHYGSLDALAMGVMLKKEKVFFLAKKELIESKLFGWLFKVVGCIPVNRGKADVAAMKAGLDKLNSGRKLVVFPQGHRYKDYKVSQGKRGASNLAIKTDSPIIPVTIMRKWRAGIKHVTCFIHEPMQADGRSEKEFIKAVMEKIGEKL